MSTTSTEPREPAAVPEVAPVVVTPFTGTRSGGPDRAPRSVREARTAHATAEPADLRGTVRAACGRRLVVRSTWAPAAWSTMRDVRRAAAQNVTTCAECARKAPAPTGAP